MQQVNISEFRSHLLKYLEKAKIGESFSVTSNGKVLATISPPVNQNKQARAQLKFLAKTAKIKDVLTPIESDWDVLS